MKQTISGRQKEILMSAVANGESIRTPQVMKMLNIGPSRTREILAELVNEKIFEACGGKKTRMYRLKSKE